MNDKPTYIFSGDSINKWKVTDEGIEFSICEMPNEVPESSDRGGYTRLSGVNMSYDEKVPICVVCEFIGDIDTNIRFLSMFLNQLRRLRDER